MLSTAESVAVVQPSSSPSAGSRRPMHNSNNKRKHSHDSSDSSGDEYDASSVVDQVQKRKRLESLKQAKKAKLSTQQQPSKKFKTDAFAKSLPPRTARAAANGSTKAGFRYNEQPFVADEFDCASYFEMVTARECSMSIQEESEDFCFICKDGGELIECDWAVHGRDGHRCPKVYHEGTFELCYFSKVDKLCSRSPIFSRVLTDMVCIQHVWGTRCQRTLCGSVLATDANCAVFLPSSRVASVSLRTARYVPVISRCNRVCTRLLRLSG